MFTLAVICYTLGAVSFLFAVVLRIVFNAKKPQPKNSSGIGDLYLAGLSSLGSLRYELRIACRYAYAVLIPLGGIFHYISLT
ncbi:MAG: hypothetical protein CFH43_00299 [Proteobacteria bacterium]|nr:MAG: hypothetical protein CFH43_00299 [Pseudomonadota bacterium]